MKLRFFSDPRYPASNSVSLRRLQGNLETTEDLVHSHSLGHSLSSTSTILHETIFVIDISKDVSDETLRVSLKFAENLVIEVGKHLHVFKEGLNNFYLVYRPASN